MDNASISLQGFSFSEAMLSQDSIVIDELSGFPTGTILEDDTIVTGDYDITGAVLGWHKEPNV